MYAISPPLQGSNRAEGIIPQPRRNAKPPGQTPRQRWAIGACFSII